MSPKYVVPKAGIARKKGKTPKGKKDPKK